MHFQTSFINESNNRALHPSIRDILIITNHKPYTRLCSEFTLHLSSVSSNLMESEGFISHRKVINDVRLSLLLLCIIIILIIIILLLFAIKTINSNHESSFPSIRLKSFAWWMDDRQCLLGIRHNKFTFISK